MDDDDHTERRTRIRPRTPASIRGRDGLRRAIQPVLVVQEMLELVLRHMILESEVRARTRSMALRRILISKGLVTAEELETAESELGARPLDEVLERNLHAQYEWVDQRLGQLTHDWDRELATPTTAKRAKPKTSRPRPATKVKPVRRRRSVAAVP